MAVAVASPRMTGAAVAGAEERLYDEHFRPSEYTAGLLHVLRREAARLPLKQVLEVGAGSGVVLGLLGRLGAARLHGVDIEADAVVNTRRLLESLGLLGRAEVVQGDLWQPFLGRRFDLIVANLPHFPSEAAEYSGRYPSWSWGGRDGRRLLDPFIAGLPGRLMPGGRGIITHNAFVDLDRSRDILRQRGFALRSLYTIPVFISPDKLRTISADVLARYDGKEIYRVGSYTFAEVHIVEIGRPGDLISSSGSGEPEPR